VNFLVAGPQVAHDVGRGVPAVVVRTFKLLRKMVVSTLDMLLAPAQVAIISLERVTMTVVKGFVGRVPRLASLVRRR
jgi:hypothetical protein